MGKKKELFDNEIRKAQKELYDIEKRFCNSLSRQ